jgi:hypothetical protein
VLVRWQRQRQRQRQHVHVHRGSFDEVQIDEPDR